MTGITRLSHLVRPDTVKVVAERGVIRYSELMLQPFRSHLTQARSNRVLGFRN